MSLTAVRRVHGTIEVAPAPQSAVRIIQQIRERESRAATDVLPVSPP